MDYLRYSLQEDIIVHELITVYYLELDKNFVSFGERHDFWEMVYVDTGEVEVCTDGSIHLLAQGDLMLYRPNEFHIGRTSRGMAPSLFIVSFECRSPAMELFWTHRRFKAGETESRQLSLLIQEAYNAFGPDLLAGNGEKGARAGASPFGSEQMCKIHLESLLIQFIRSVRKPSAESKKLMPIVREKREERLIGEIRQYIADHLHSELTIEHLTGKFAVSRSHLGMLFKQHCRKGIIEYVIHAKVDKAKQLIREQWYNISQISELLGYSGVHYFSRQFKQTTGTAPSEYARSVKARWER